MASTRGFHQAARVITSAISSRRSGNRIAQDGAACAAFAQRPRGSVLCALRAHANIADSSAGCVTANCAFTSCVAGLIESMLLRVRRGGGFERL